MESDYIFEVGNGIQLINVAQGSAVVMDIVEVRPRTRRHLIQPTSVKVFHVKCVP